MLDRAHRLPARAADPKPKPPAPPPAGADAVAPEEPATAASPPRADELGALLTRSVADRAPLAAAGPGHATLARLFDKGFWLIGLDGTYTWHQGTDATGFPKAPDPDYKDPSSYFAWPVHYANADIAAFAGLTGRWRKAEIVALKAAFDLDAGGMSAADWVRVADAGDPLRNQVAAVALFARIAGWSSDRKVALAGLYVATTRHRRAAAHWAEIAAELTGADDAAAFARLPDSWARGPVVALAGLFHADPGGRTAADWAGLAGANAVLAGEDQAVALLARSAWTPDAATALIAAADEAGAPGEELKRLLATTRAVRGLLAMTAGGWSSQDLGTFAGTLLYLGQPASKVSDFVSRAAIGAGTMTMRTAWDPEELGGFVDGAIDAGLDAGAIKVLIATPDFATWSYALTTGSTAQDAGTYSAQASLAPKEMKSAGWTLRELGALIAAMGAVKFKFEDAVALMKLTAFATGSQAMCTAGWTAAQVGGFVVGALKDAKADEATVADLTDTADFADASTAWFTPGWSGRDIGAITANAVKHGVAAATLVTFMQVVAAPASAFALKRLWGALEIGRTVGHCLSRTGPPTEAQMERLLFYAATRINGKDILPAKVRLAADAATCGAPDWTVVIQEIPNFQARYSGTRAVNSGTPKVAGQTPSGADFTLYAPGERIQHVEAGHTYEHLDFSYGNCTREGVGGNISFFPGGTNVRTTLAGLCGNATVQGLAANAIAGVGATQGPAAGCVVGVAGFAPVSGVHPMIISQCYPSAGTRIVGRTLVAIGRYFGLTA
jgi:hypothetical protein